MIKLYYGVDPGAGKRTGLAIWNPGTQKFLTLITTTIIEAMHLIRLDNSDEDCDQTIFVEDARQRKWFNDARMTATERINRLQGVGSNKRDASIWEQFGEFYGIKTHMVHPKDNTTKTTSEHFKNLTKYEGRTSEHSRDAGMLVFGRQ